MNAELQGFEIQCPVPCDDDFAVDLDFQVKFHDRVVAVPRGGGIRGIEIRVNPK